MVYFNGFSCRHSVTVVLKCCRRKTLSNVGYQVLANLPDLWANIINKRTHINFNF